MPQTEPEINEAEQLNDQRTRVVSEAEAQPKPVTRTLVAGTARSEPPNPRSQVAVGQVLAGRFVLTRFLGSGGMGQVYAAEDQMVGETVALKIIRCSGESTELDRKRLKREVLLARKVTHRNVCRIFDLFLHENPEKGEVFDVVSMELIDGETLAERTTGPLPPHEALPIVRQIARGLNAAHQLGIVHRDLKPGNVMLVREEQGDRVAVTDFGLARQLSAEATGDSMISQDGDLVGTPAYMSPEQVAGEPISPASDIFSLGIMLFELLSGKLPYERGSAWRMVVNRLTTEPIALEVYVPEIDARLAALVARCLKRDPHERFTSARDLLEELDGGDPSWNFYGKKDSEPTDRPGASAKPSEDHLASARAPSGSAGDRRHWRWLVALSLTVGLALGSRWWTESNHLPDVPIRLQTPDASSELADLMQELPPLPSGPGATSQVADPPADTAIHFDELLRWVDADLAAYDGSAALDRLRPSLEAWPEHPLLELRLAEAYWHSGRDDDARQAIENAKRQAERVPPPERDFLEALDRGFHGDWIAAHDRLKYLWQATGEARFGIWALEAHDYSGSKERVPEIINGLKALPDGEGLDPRIGLLQGRLALDHEPGDVIPLMEQTIREAKQRNLPILNFFALRILSRAHLEVSNQSDAENTLVRQSLLVEGLDDPYLKATFLFDRAARAYRLGQNREAEFLIGQAGEQFEKLGATRSLCHLKIWQATLANVEDSERLRPLQQAAEACAQSGLADLEAHAYQNLAWYSNNLRQREAAFEYLQQSASLSKQIDDRRGLAAVELILAKTLTSLGRIGDALARTETALEWIRTENQADTVTWGLLLAAETAIMGGQVDRASVLLDELVELGTSSQRRRVLEYYNLRANLEFARADRDALSRALLSLREHNRLQQLDYFRARTVEVEAGVAELEGRHDEARRLLESAEISDAGRIRLARYQLRAGDVEAAQRSLEAIDDEPSQTVVWQRGIVQATIASVDSRSAAVERLLVIENEASRVGHYVVALDARMARAHLLGEARLFETIRDEAQSLGLRRLALEAEGWLAASQQMLGDLPG